MYKKKELIARILIATFLLSLFLPWVIIKSQPDVPNNFDEFKNTMQIKMPELMKYYNVPGSTIGIIEDGKIKWIETFGFADKFNLKPVKNNTDFQVGSISMAITAWGVMKLVEQGKIDLDKPVDKYLTRWHLPTSQFNEKVTVRTILSQTAGLSQRDYSGYESNMVLPSLEDSLSGKSLGNNGVYVQTEPEKSYAFSSGGYTLIQLIIEEVTGEKFSDYMEREILLPLGMNDSFFEPKPELSYDIAVGYGQLGQTLPLYAFTEEAASGLYSSVEDLSKFIAAGLDGPDGEPRGRGIISPQTLSMMYIPANNGFSVGYVSETLSSGDVNIGHNGANRGWRSMFMMMPGKNDGIVLMTNSDTGVNFIRDIGVTWVKWKADSVPNWYKVKQTPRNIALYSALFLGIVLIMFCSKLIVKIILGERMFITKNILNKKWKFILQIGSPIVSAIAWWIFFYAPIFQGGWPVATVMPTRFPKVTCVVTLWCVYFLVLGLFPKIILANKISSKYDVPL